MKKIINWINHLQMEKITDWIKHHQIAVFFLITFAISWGLGFSWGAVLNRDQGLLLPLAFITACGPGLAGIIINAITNTQPREGSRKAFWIAFFMAWFLSAVISFANLKFVDHFPLSPVVVVPFTIATVPVAFVIASAFSRIPSVRHYLASLIQLRDVWPWAILALVLFPALLLFSFPVYGILNRLPILFYQFQESGSALLGLIAVKFFYQLFFFNATGEETGWRGFALPRLQSHFSPLIAALIIAFFWVPWHFFGWQAEGQSVLTIQFWVEMFIGHILLSVLIVWICNRAGGSILVAGIAHAATNTVQAFVPIQDMRSLFLTLFIAVVVLILVDRMWEKLPADHPVVYRLP